VPSNAAIRDAAAIECHRIYAREHLGVA